MKKSIREKCAQYLDRAEKLQTFIDSNKEKSKNSNKPLDLEKINVSEQSIKVDKLLGTYSIFI